MWEAVDRAVLSSVHLVGVNRLSACIESFGVQSWQDVGMV